MEKKQENEILKDFEDALRTPRKHQKMRITTMIDADVLDKLKELSKKQGIGYQTYLNDALRAILIEPESGVSNEISELRRAIRDISSRLKRVEKKEAG